MTTNNKYTPQFAGKSALVTGGGIGRASALALAAEGALVTVAPTSPKWRKPSRLPPRTSTVWTSL